MGRVGEPDGAVQQEPRMIEKRAVFGVQFEDEVTTVAITGEGDDGFLAASAVAASLATRYPGCRIVQRLETIETTAWRKVFDVGGNG